EGGGGGTGQRGRTAFDPAVCQPGGGQSASGSGWGPPEPQSAAGRRSLRVGAGDVRLDLALLLVFGTVGPLTAVATDVTAPRVRGTAFAFNLCCLHLLGDIPAPTVIGSVSDPPAPPSPP